MDIRFYQSQRKPPETVLAVMLKRTLERNETAIVRCRDPQTLSAFLWRCDGFIPHGTAAENNPEHQKIWLTNNSDNPIAAETLFLYNTDKPLPQINKGEDDSQFAHIILLFDKKNTDTANAMQQFLKTLTKSTDPQNITYWHDENGKWQQKTTENT